MYLGDDKNCKAFFASANYPYSEDFLTTVSRPSPWCRGATTSISALFENFKECEKAQDIRAEFKSIENQVAENVKRLVTDQEGCLQGILVRAFLARHKSRSCWASSASYTRSRS